MSWKFRRFTRCFRNWTQIPQCHCMSSGKYLSHLCDFWKLCDGSPVLLGHCLRQKVQKIDDCQKFKIFYTHSWKCLNNLLTEKANNQPEMLNDSLSFSSMAPLWSPYRAPIRFQRCPMESNGLSGVGCPMEYNGLNNLYVGAATPSRTALEDHRQFQVWGLRRYGVSFLTTTY